MSMTFPKEEIKKGQTPGKQEREKGKKKREKKERSRMKRPVIGLQREKGLHSYFRTLGLTHDRNGSTSENICARYVRDG